MCTLSKLKVMKIITTREIRKETKAFFELAEKEQVVVKRRKKYVNLIVTDEPDTQFVSENRVKEFMSILDNMPIYQSTLVYWHISTLI